MNNTCTICHGNVAVADNIVSFLLCLNRIKGFVFFIFKVCTFICLQNVVCAFSKNCIGQCLCQIVHIIFLFHLNFDVSLIRINTKCNVGRQCPRCCCPCEDISVFASYLETCNGRSFFDIFITLCNFMA